MAGGARSRPFEFALRNPALPPDVDVVVERAVGAASAPELAGSRLRGQLSETAQRDGLGYVSGIPGEAVLTLGNRRIVFRLRPATVGAEVVLQNRMRQDLGEVLENTAGEITSSAELHPY